MRTKEALVMLAILLLFGQGVSLCGPAFPPEYLRTFDSSWCDVKPDKGCSMAKSALVKAPTSPDCAVRCLELCGASVLLPSAISAHPRVREKRLELKWWDEKSPARKRSILQQWGELKPDNALPKYLLVEHLFQQGENAAAVNLFRSMKSPRIVFPHCELPSSSRIRFVPRSDVPRTLWGQPIPIGLLKYWYEYGYSSPARELGVTWPMLLATSLSALGDGRAGIKPEDAVNYSVRFAVSWMRAEPLQLWSVMQGVPFLRYTLIEASLRPWWKKHRTRQQVLEQSIVAICHGIDQEIGNFETHYPYKDLLAMTRACRKADPIEGRRKRLRALLNRYTPKLLERADAIVQP